MKRIQVEIHGLQNDQSIPVLVWMLVRENYKKLADVTTRIESLYPNCRFESISCFLDNTIVPLHEDIGILEDNEKVTVKVSVSSRSVSLFPEVVTIKDEEPEVTTDNSFTPAESTSSCQEPTDDGHVEIDINSNTINLIDDFLDDISDVHNSGEPVPIDDDEDSPVKVEDDNDNHAEENVKENLIFKKCKVCSKMVMSSRMKAHMNKFHKATWTLTEVTDDVEVDGHPPAKRLKLRKACTVDSSAKSTDFDISAALCERLDERLDGQLIGKIPNVSIENLDTQADRIRPEDPIEERRLTLEKDVLNTYRILESGDHSKQQCGSCSKDTDDSDGVLHRRSWGIF